MRRQLEEIKNDEIDFNDCRQTIREIKKIEIELMYKNPNNYSFEYFEEIKKKCYFTRRKNQSSGGQIFQRNYQTNKSQAGFYKNVQKSQSAYIRHRKF